MQIQAEWELGTLASLPVGTVAELAQTDGTIWGDHVVGNTTPEIAVQLGWTEGNVWLREPERQYMLKKRGGLFSDLEPAIAHVLAHPQSVHENPRAVGEIYFVTGGSSLRQVGLIQSDRVRFVDVVVEARHVEHGRYLRVFHFAPTTRNIGGQQLWP